VTRRRKFFIALAALAALAVMAVVIAHTRGVQRPVFDRVTAAIEEQTGVTVTFGEAGLRLWPARLVAEEIEISISGTSIARVERLEAQWNWTAVWSEPRHVSDIVIDGLDGDLTDIPPLPERETVHDPDPSDPWRMVEIGRLEVRGNGGTGAVTEMVAGLDGLKVQARLVDGVAGADLQAARLWIERSERVLDLGSVAVDVTADGGGIEVRAVDLTGGAVEGEGRGEASFDDPMSAKAGLHFVGDLAGMVTWWDPNIASGLEPDGVLDAECEIALTEGEMTADLIHRGSRLRLAGYDLDELELHHDGANSEVRLRGKTWGDAEVSIDRAFIATVTASLQNAPVERLLMVAAPELAMRLDGPVSVTGDLAGTLSYPFSLDTLSGDLDVQIETQEGIAAVAMVGAGGDWTVHKARLDLDGIQLEGDGGLSRGVITDSKIDLLVENAASLRTVVAEWMPHLELPEFSGGPLAGTMVADGAVGSPRVDADLRWTNPSIAGVDAEAIHATAVGDLDDIQWTVTAHAEGIELAADGSLVPAGMKIDGYWRFDLDSLQRTAGMVPVDLSDIAGLTGRLDGDGRFSYDGVAWGIDGVLRGHGLGIGEWRTDGAEVSFGLDPEQLRLDKANIEFLGGTIVGSTTVGLEGFDAPVTGEFEWRDIDLTQSSVDLRLGDSGITSGEIDMAGTLSRPTGVVEIEWTPVDREAGIPELTFAGVLENGALNLVTEEVSAGGGSLWVDGEVPLGSLPLPEWLWPDAPAGELRMTARGKEIASDAIGALFGWVRQSVSVTTDLDLEASWDPVQNENARVLGELMELEIVHPGGRIKADGPVVFSLADSKIELSPVSLTGLETRILMAGSADLASGAIAGSLEAVLAPGIARAVPYPVQIHEPINVSATVGGTTSAPELDFSVDHPGGAIVFRDPPLRIRDLVLSAEVADNTVWINDGRARVNQGTMEIGGGWDPELRQGIVAEFDDVVVFVEGILSQWSGAVAIEPTPGEIAKVVGEMNLVAGLWDERVSLGGAFFGGDSLDPASDDPLEGVTLDLDVRGRGTVRVDNNLGRFDARWDVIRTTGSLARPRLNGEISIAPGGTFSLAGQRVKVRRGSLLFTGDPDVDPIVEIVPENNFGAFGGEEGQINTTAMAAQGLVGGLAGALGFENETLEPAEISVETEKNTADQFMLGQRLSHNVALFFATSTKDVQDRTSMVQLWNVPGLKGLALQGYEKTLTDEMGANLIQRFQWGGKSLYDDRPTIRKLKLDGDWPLKERRLRRSTGLRKGQPYDPFLPFVARVRMERELASAGYQEVRVTVEAVESDNAWTLHFECEPGERREVVFEGDIPPTQVRKEITAMYQHPPLEEYSLRNMRTLLDRSFDADGYPAASIEVERSGEVVVARVAKGDLTKLSGPVLDGVPDLVADAVTRRLGSTAELAVLASEPQRAEGLIEKVLADEGYRNARVEGVQAVSTGDESAEVRVAVDLGAPAVVSQIIVTGSDPLNFVESDGFGLKTGITLDRLAVDLAASQLRAGYDAAGYSDAEIRGTAEQAAEGGWVVTLNVQPGIRRVFEGVEVTGLKHTSRRSIESGLTIEEGEILKNSDLDAAAMRIANFAPIERVEVRTVPQGASGAKVELDVIEKKRWTAEVGGGWSTERGVQARFGLRDDNLFGRGFSLNLRGRWDQTEWLGFVIASLPPLPGKRLSFSSTVGFSRGEAPQNPEILDQDESFWSIEGTRWLGKGERATGHAGEQITAYYQFTRTRTYGLDDSGFIPIYIDSTLDVGLLGARYVKDRFDSPFDPTSGYGLLFDVGYSDDFLGSELKYVTAFANWSTATKIGASTWISGVRAGASEPFDGYELTSEVKFLAGGQGSIRGFDRDSVGPVEYGIDGWTPAGGGALAIFNEELRIPVFGGLRAALFADIGQVWETWGAADWNFAVGAGVGIRWATPIGPVWLDIAWPVVNPDIAPPDSSDPVRPMSSSKPKFYIGIGRPF